MFQQRRTTTGLGSAATTLELIYHATVRSLRKSHNNAVIGLVMTTLQSLLFIGIFLTMFLVLGMRSSPIRGDYLLFVMSGVFIYMTHVKALAAVAGSEGPASPMLQHAPMTTAISIMSNALASLYQQVFSAAVILTFYHIAFNPVKIDKPAGAAAMLLLAWVAGVAVGIIILALKPWLPQVMPMVQMIYTRANMIFSGKMLAANSTPYTILVFFSWNPLFHIIDQCRGFVFIDYVPMKSNLSYPIEVISVLFVLGLMGEFFTRKHASKSWGARG